MSGNTLTLTNLLTNPDFENGTTGWTAVNGTFDNSTTIGVEHGTHSLGIGYDNGNIASMNQSVTLGSAHIYYLAGYCTAWSSGTPGVSHLFINSQSTTVPAEPA